ncbi:MAG: nucleotidyltransferase domain-containing protein [Candidatus Omnitrophota bacterium]
MVVSKEEVFLAEGLKPIKAVLKKHKNEIFRKFHIKEMAVFGSFANGAPKAVSDVENLVGFDEVPDLLDFISVKYYLENLFHKKVDLAREQALRKELKYAVKKAVRI